MGLKSNSWAALPGGQGFELEDGTQRQVQPVVIVDKSGAAVGPSAGGSTLSDTYSLKTTAGTIAAGALFVSVYNNGGTDGTLQGQTFPAGARADYPYIPGYVHPAISYDPGASQYIVMEVRSA